MTLTRNREDSETTNPDEIIHKQTQQITGISKASYLDVTLYMRDKDNKKRDLQPEDVFSLYTEGKLKYRLDYDGDLRNEDFEALILQKAIKETHIDVKHVRDDIYKKIRNGREKTPTSTYEQSSKTAHLRH